MATIPAAITMPALLRGVSPDSLVTNRSSSFDVWGSGEATPVTSPPSSRGESPERKPEQVDGVARHTRSDATTIVTLSSAPPVRNICFVGAGFVGAHNTQKSHRPRFILCSHCSRWPHGSTYCIPQPIHHRQRRGPQRRAHRGMERESPAHP